MLRHRRRGEAQVGKHCQLQFQLLHQGLHAWRDTSAKLFSRVVRRPWALGGLSKRLLVSKPFKLVGRLDQASPYPTIQLFQVEMEAGRENGSVRVRCQASPWLPRPNPAETRASVPTAAAPAAAAVAMEPFA